MRRRGGSRGRSRKPKAAADEAAEPRQHGRGALRCKPARAGDSQRAARRGIARIYIPPERPRALHLTALRGRDNRVRFREQLHRLRIEDTSAIEFTIAEQHAAVTGEIVRGGEQLDWSALGQLAANDGGLR